MEASVRTEVIYGVYTTSIVAKVIANCCYLKLLLAVERSPRCRTPCRQTGLRLLAGKDGGLMGGDGVEFWILPSTD